MEQIVFILHFKALGSLSDEEDVMHYWEVQEINIEGSSGIQNGLGRLNGSENQRKHRKQNHQMTQRGFPSLPNVCDTSG